MQRKLSLRRNAKYICLLILCPDALQGNIPIRAPKPYSIDSTGLHAPSALLHALGMVAVAHPQVPVRTAPTGSQSSINADAPNFDVLVEHEIAILELCGGGSPLSPAERQTAATLSALGLRLDRAAWLANDAKIVLTLQHTLPRDAVYLSSVRESCRLTIEIGRAPYPAFQPVLEGERPIVQQHDPTIVFDPKTKELVTEFRLRKLQQRGTWFAQKEGFPSPDASFVAVVTRELQTRFLSMTSTLQDSFARIESNSLHLSDGRSSNAAGLRTALQPLSGAALQWNLAISIAFMSQSSATSAGMSTYLSQQQLVNRQMQGNSWQLGHPQCGINGS